MELYRKVRLARRGGMSERAAAVQFGVSRASVNKIILNWRREDGDEDYHHLLRRDEWEVVLPELVFEAGAQAVMADQIGS